MGWPGGGGPKFQRQQCQRAMSVYHRRRTKSTTVRPIPITESQNFAGWREPVLQLHRVRVASRAPSERLLNFSQTIAGWTSGTARGMDAKPQSAPAVTFS